MGLYEGRNCENYQRISMCDTDVRPNTSISFSNTKPLTIGQYYWLVIDGNGGDKCDYELKVTKGTTKIPIINEGANLQFDNVTCQGKATSLTAIPPIGATEFEWTINNQKIPQNNRTVQHVFGNEGEYDVCVEIYNVCSRGPKSCKKIRVTPPEPISDTVAICPNTTLSIQNKTYQFGTHLILFRDSISCDSLVNLTIVPLEVAIPEIYLDDTLHVVLGEGRQINADVNYNYLKRILWTPSIDLNCTQCLDPFLNSITEGKLFLEVWTEDDCYAIDSLSYFLIKDIRYVTPNVIKQKSEENGIFSIYFAGSVKEVKLLTIYDRWGSEVFKSSNELPKWDGSNKGKSCEEGIYTWVAELLLFDESLTSISGSLMVLKE
jgi:hypothetical protein